MPLETPLPAPAYAGPPPTDAGVRTRTAGSAREMEADELTAFLRSHKWGVLATVRDGRPYAVPVSYGFDGTDFYIGSGPGRKLDCLLSSPAVCLTITEVTDGSHWSSVVVGGDAIALGGVRERLAGLNVIRVQQRGERALSPKDLARAARATVFRLAPLEVSGRICR